jgi:hypothetical protein
MSIAKKLVKNPKMTEANRAAHRANGRKSRGATTPAGKERARAANLRHGYYSEIRDGAIVALGEDPARLRRLIDAAYDEWRPQSDYQSALAERTARLLWRMDRAERAQESLAIERVETLTQIKDGLTLRARRRYLEMLDMLEFVHLFAGRPEFYATPNLVRDFTHTLGEPMGGLVQDVLKLLLQLRKPANFSQGAKTLPGDVADDEDWQDYLSAEAPEEVTDWELPVPDQPVAEGEDREPLRLKLRALAGELEGDFRNSREMQKAAGVLSGLDRDVMWAKAHQERALMRREEESCFREFWRLTTILINMQGRKKDLEKQELAGQDSGSRIRDCGQQDSAVGGGPPQRSAAGAEQRSGFEQPTASPRRPKSGRARKSASALAQIKNEGASGDVDENTEEQNSKMPANAPEDETDSPATVAP